MPDNDVKPGTTVGAGQAPAQPANTVGQPSGANGGQSAEVKPPASFDYEKGYKELQPKFTTVTQENASLKKEKELLDSLRSDKRFQAWVAETFPQEGATQNNPPEDTEIDDSWMYEPAKLINKMRELMREEYNKAILQDPLRQEYGKDWINKQFDQAKANGCVKMDQYRKEIEEYFRQNPNSPHTPEDMYHMFEGRDRVKQEAIDKQKENLGSEEPKLTPAGTLPDHRNFDSIFDHAMKKLGKK